jgi:hypothetical protein
MILFHGDGYNPSFRLFEETTADQLDVKAVEPSVPKKWGFMERSDLQWRVSGVCGLRPEYEIDDDYAHEIRCRFFEKIGVHPSSVIEIKHSGFLDHIESYVSELEKSLQSLKK